jgi:hypothetical protein
MAFARHERTRLPPLPWIMVSLLIGPVVWPLALIEALSGLPAPEMFRRGKRGSGALDIFVLFEDDHVPDWIEAELQRLMPSCRRLLARVIKAGVQRPSKPAPRVPKRHRLSARSEGCRTPAPLR